MLKSSASLCGWTSLSWLYSDNVPDTDAGPPSIVFIFELIPAATLSLFVKSFLPVWGSGWTLNDNGNFCMCSWQQICTRRLYNIIFIHDHLDVLLLTKTQIHPHTVWACWNIPWFKEEKKTEKKKAYTQPPLFPTDSTLTQLGSLREYTLSDQNKETTGLWRKVFSVNVGWTLEMEGFHLAQLWFI